MTQDPTRRSSPSRCLEDVAIGEQIPTLVRGPITPAHLFRWSAAVENWHRIHYDRDFAVHHDGLPERLINGSFKQHLLVQVVRGWAEPDGWLWKIGFQFRGMDVVGDTLTAFGSVTETRRVGDLGLVTLEIGLRNQDGALHTPGSAVVALPVRGGPPVPYPFEPPRGG